MGISGVVRNDHIGLTIDLWPEKIVDAEYEEHNGGKKSG